MSIRRCTDEEAKKFPYVKIFGYLTRVLTSDKTSVKDVAIQTIRSILQVSYSRLKLYEESEDCLYELVNTFKKTSEEPEKFQGIVAIPQLQYGIVMCFWLLSFDKQVAAKLNRWVSF